MKRVSVIKAAAILLSLILVFSAAAVSLPALAEEAPAEPAIFYFNGSDGLNGEVVYGRYMDEFVSEGDGGYYFAVNSIPWRILKTGDGNLVLLSRNIIDRGAINPTYADVLWSRSTLRSWLNGYGADENDKGNDYTGTGFVDEAFSPEEADALGLPGIDKVTLLSKSQALSPSLGFTENNQSSDTRLAGLTGYALYGGTFGSKLYYTSPGDPFYWWLRPDGDQLGTCLVSATGYINFGTTGRDIYGIRPVITINPEKIFFVSKGKKEYNVNPADIASASGDAYYLTVIDSTRQFKISKKSLMSVSGGTVSLDFTGCKTGDYEFISVLLCSSEGEMLKYFSPMQPESADGTLTFDLPELANGTYTLRIFNEQRNQLTRSNNAVDYASPASDITLTVCSEDEYHAILFNEHKSDLVQAVEDLALPDDSAVCTAMTDTAKNAVLSVFYDSGKSIDENINALNTAADLEGLAARLEAQRAKEAAEAQLAADKAAFEEYKAGLATQADALAQAGDSAQCTALIKAAKEEIAALGFDESRSLDENKETAASVIDRLESDLSAHRKEYTAKFVDENGVTVAEVKFTIDTESIQEPEVPIKDGYDGKWSDYTLAASDITVIAVYTKIDTPTPSEEYKLPTSFKEQTAAYNTIVTVRVTLKNVPSGAKVYIDGKEAAVSGSTYSAEIGQASSTKNVIIEVKQGTKVLDSSTLTVKVDTGFFAKLISFFTNFLFNLFSWKKVTVNF
jgi:hypothetical protein